MCNPRRVRVAASQQVDLAWQAEVSRTIELCATVSGEARIRQGLDSELSPQTLRALEMALATPDSGWQEVEGGYRRDVDGGHVVYLTDERALEIVATSSDEIRALGEASREIEGRVTRDVRARGTGDYYEDGYRGRTEEAGRRDAEQDANRNIEALKDRHVERAKRRAERHASGEVEAEARARAESDLERRAEARRSQLEGEARRHLDAVGLRGRQAFNRVLASAYRDAILAYARANHADGVVCTETGEVIEIEFKVSR
jgi:hypothetical protein